MWIQVTRCCASIKSGTDLFWSISFMIDSLISIAPTPVKLSWMICVSNWIGYEPKLPLENTSQEIRMVVNDVSCTQNMLYVYVACLYHWVWFSVKIFAFDWYHYYLIRVIIYIHFFTYTCIPDNRVFCVCMVFSLYVQSYHFWSRTPALRVSSACRNIVRLQLRRSCLC